MTYNVCFNTIREYFDVKKIHLCLNKTIFKVTPTVQILILMTILSTICKKIIII